MELREQIAIRLHTQERSLLRVAIEDSPTNCSWEQLDDYWKDNFRKSSDQILDLIKEAGYLPVEPVQLEVLGDEEMRKILDKYYIGFDPNIAGEISQATIVHNEAKGQLYRKLE